MWQSRVEIEHYSIAYFDHVTAFEALYRSTSIKGGARMCYVDLSDIDGASLHMSPVFNGSTAIQRIERGNTVEIRNGIMFQFLPGLPHMVVFSDMFYTLIE